MRGPRSRGVRCHRLQKMKSTAHVEKFVSLFSVVENRLGNEALRLSDKDGNPLPGVNLEAFAAFQGGQVARPGEGDESTVDKELLEIVIKHYESKVDSLDPEANSAALLKRANGWHKRPEKAATSEETKANKTQVTTQNKLAQELSEAQEKHGEDSAEAKAAGKALMEYALSNIGK